MLQPKDVKNFLKRASAAIQLDQVYVDALPSESFAREYDDSMWRVWRREHRSLINKLLRTADAIQPATLRELTRITAIHEPSHIGAVVLDLFAELVGGNSAEDIPTAEQFFSWAIRQLPRWSKSGTHKEGARASILQWVPLLDPLHIADDPQCGYGVPLR
jgi:hypothetical protein